jgi:DNA primase
MPVMIHESLRKLAGISHVPEAALGIGQISLPDLFIKKSGSITLLEIDPNRILEGDFIRWLLVAASQYPQLKKMAKANILKEHLCIPAAARLYEEVLFAFEENRDIDLLSLGIACLESEEDQKLLKEIMQRKINISKAEEGFKETVRRILMRQWMQERETIRSRLQSGNLTDEEMSDLARQFDAIKNRVPEVVEC